MSVSVDLQALVWRRLTQDAGVSAIVGDRVYDNVPADAAFPYVSFGPSDYRTDDAECIGMHDETMQIDVWARDAGRLRGGKALADAVKAALHETTGELDGGANAELMVVSARTMLDPDGLTTHGVVTLQCLVELAPF